VNGHDLRFIKDPLPKGEGDKSGYLWLS